MKTISKTLYRREYTTPTAYNFDKINASFEIKLHFDFKEGLRFSVSAPNIGVCRRNPFAAIFEVMEHQSVGYCKYQRLKDDCRALGFWQHLQ